MKDWLRKLIIEEVMSVMGEEESEASKQAKQRGLVSTGWGRYAHPSNPHKTVAKTVDGKLVNVTDDEPTGTPDKPDTNTIPDPYNPKNAPKLGGPVNKINVGAIKGQEKPKSSQPAASSAPSSGKPSTTPTDFFINAATRTPQDTEFMKNFHPEHFIRLFGGNREAAIDAVEKAQNKLMTTQYPPHQLRYVDLRDRKLTDMARQLHQVGHRAAPNSPSIMKNPSVTSDEGAMAAFHKATTPEEVVKLSGSPEAAVKNAQEITDHFVEQLKKVTANAGKLNSAYGEKWTHNVSIRLATGIHKWQEMKKTLESSLATHYRNAQADDAYARQSTQGHGAPPLEPSTASSPNTAFSMTKNPDKEPDNIQQRNAQADDAYARQSTQGHGAPPFEDKPLDRTQQDIADDAVYVEDDVIERAAELFHSGLDKNAVFNALLKGVWNNTEGLSREEAKELVTNVKAWVDAGYQKYDNYDGPRDNGDAWSGGFAANH